MRGAVKAAREAFTLILTKPDGEVRVLHPLPCPVLSRHLHPDNRSICPLCDDCIGANAARDIAWAWLQRFVAGGTAGGGGG